ncbi:MAG: helix-turn-helix transcriptional regulator [Minisyncoccia bacterium]|jgi:transcriptional regulator with XRE-family HTH domain
MARRFPGYHPIMEYDRYKKIPNALKRYRKERGLTQLQVARALGFKDKTWISHWENGDALPNLVSIIRLSALYQTPIEVLFADLSKAIQEEVI